MSADSSQSTFQLLSLSSQGDIGAFSELFQRFSERLFNFAYYLTYSKEDSEDITSETFISVYQAIQGKDVSTFNLQAYLYKTAKSASLKSIERRKREGLTMEETLAFKDHGLFADPEKATLLSEQREKVREASEELTLDQQSALLLKELEGLPYDTIASILDSNPNAVGALLSRARLKFREVFRMTHAATEGMTDDCLSITPLLSKYIDKETTEEEQELVRAHLETCPICKENLESMQEASTTYRSLIPFLPLATFKVWSMAKTVIAGKAVVASASAAGSAAGGAGATGAGAGGTAVSAGAVSAAGAGVTAAAVATGTAATGLGLFTKIMIIIGTVLVLGGAGTGGYYAIKTTMFAKTTVPNLIGLRESEANQQVKNADLELKVSKTGNSGDEVVASQNPVPGKKVNRGTAIGVSLRDRTVDTVVFVREGNIYKINLDGTGEKQLTSGGGVASHPAISPDGMKIAFDRRFGTGDSAYSEIWVIDASGSNQKELTSFQSGDGDCSHPSWFPSSKKLLFFRVRNYDAGRHTPYTDSLSTVVLDTKAINDIKAITLSSYEEDKFVDPVISPDGSKIYSISNYEGGDDFLINDAKTGAPLEPTGLNQGYRFFAPSVSADSRKIACYAEKPEQSNVGAFCITNKDASEASYYPVYGWLLSVFDGPPILSSWTSDGRLIISKEMNVSNSQTSDAIADIFIMNYTTSETKELTKGSSASYGGLVGESTDDLEANRAEAEKKLKEADADVTELKKLSINTTNLEEDQKTAWSLFDKAELAWEFKNAADSAQYTIDDCSDLEKAHDSEKQVDTSAFRRLAGTYSNPSSLNLRHILLNKDGTFERPGQPVWKGKYTASGCWLTLRYDDGTLEHWKILRYEVVPNGNGIGTLPNLISLADGREAQVQNYFFKSTGNGQ